MIINRNFKDFKFQHKRNQNQVLFISEKIKSDQEILNLIDNFLTEKNSFIFESVEKGKIKCRYTIFGKNPDKIQEFNNNNSYLIKNKKKYKLKKKPEKLIESIIEEFKFKIPSGLPPISSLISGYFSYDSIRYIENIPNNCKDDLKVPDVRLLRPRTLIIHDNVKRKIFYIINIFQDEKINNYTKKYFEIIIQEYPNTDFALDSEYKLELIQELLASKEMYLARYYVEKEKWIPAINRFKTVVKDYDSTIYVEEALHRLVELHYKMGLIDDCLKQMFYIF